MTTPQPQSFWQSRSGVVFVAFTAIAAFYLLTEHTAHVFGVLPFLLILACPFLHLFHGGGHGAHENGDTSDEQPEGRPHH